MKRTHLEVSHDGTVDEEDVDGVTTHTFPNGDQLLFGPVLKPSTIKGLSRHEAAAEALKALDKPARIPEIIDVLVAAGHGKDLKRHVLHNAVYTAMDRKRAIFTKDGPVWGLKEWEKAK